jgi:hypothetical protein
VCKTSLRFLRGFLMPNDLCGAFTGYCVRCTADRNATTLQLLGNLLCSLDDQKMV